MPPVDDAGQPNYGIQKVRVGVQREDGATFPAGSSLVGATITAVETPVQGCQPDGTPKTRTTFHCTVTADPLYPDQSDGSDEPAETVDAGDPNPIADCVPEDPSSPFFGSYYLLAAGDAVTFTETSPPDGPGMLADENAYTVGPCVIPEDPEPAGPGPLADSGDPESSDAPEFPTCDGGAAPAFTPDAARPQARAQLRAANPSIYFGADIVFKVRPKVIPPVVVIPPAAVDDAASTPAGTAVPIPVLANDDAKGSGTLSISSVGAATHGTAVVDGSQIVYTPAAGFVGSDSFTYAASTPSGSSTATVTVTVTAPPAPVVSPSPTTSAPTSPSATATPTKAPTTSPTRSLGVLPTSASRAPAPPLANTGTRTGDELGVGAGLVALGGLLTFAGRRRRRAH